MDYEKTLEELKHMKVETGSFVCLGCGHEHNCSIHGCAILRDAVECIEELKRVLRESEAARADLGKRLAAVQQELAAYKDTGLEPEEIKNALDVNDIIPEINVTVDHLRDLLQAEQDGLLVVLPCKVGDTIWRIKCFADWPDIGKPYVEADAFLYRDIRYFGKTVFLTREEAEAALKGGDG